MNNGVKKGVFWKKYLRKYGLLKIKALALITGDL